ncbi:MAG: hypothetical protein KTR24_03240 [Saprospiraceae bacterium]|nr:hypothetical protein [Saprospiraceae bacterium]
MLRTTIFLLLFCLSTNSKAQPLDDLWIGMGSQVIVSGPLAANFSILGTLEVRSAAFALGETRLFYDVMGAWNMGNPASSLWMIGLGLGAERKLTGRLKASLILGLGHLREHYVLPLEQESGMAINSLIPKARFEAGIQLKPWMTLHTSIGQWSNLGSVVGASIKIRL